MYAKMNNGAVEVWNEGAEAPNIYQPQWPNGEPWASDEEALAWAEMHIESIEDPSAPFAPTGPKEQRQPKPTPEEQRLARLSALGITPDDLKFFLQQASE